MTQVSQATQVARSKSSREAAFDEDVYEPIPEERKVHWASIMMAFVGDWVSLYSVAIGYDIGTKLSCLPAVWSCVLGYAIAGVIAAIMGAVGVKKGLASYVLAKGPLAWYGQTLLALVMFTVIGFGSIGLQADAVGRSVCVLYPGLGSSRALVSGIMCAIMMITAIKGIKWMANLSWVAMPFYFVISVIATIIAVNSFGGLQAALAVEKTGMSFSRAVFLNAGAWGGFVMLITDITRFLRTKAEVYTIVPIAFVLGSIPPICGVLLGATIGVPLEALFPQLGIGLLGLISIIGIGWTTNDSNAYTAGLALATAAYPWKRMGRTMATTIVAVLGVIGAMTGIGQLKFFEWIAGFHGSYNMSFVGVMLAHYLILSRGREIQTNGLAGIVSWLTVGSLCHFNVLPIPVVTGIVLSFALYPVLYLGVEKPMFGEKVVSRITPETFWAKAPPSASQF